MRKELIRLIRQNTTEQTWLRACACLRVAQVGRANVDLRPAEPNQLRNARSPNHLREASVEYRTHAHRARFAGGVQHVIGERWLDNRREDCGKVDESTNLAVANGKVSGTSVDASGCDAAVATINNDGTKEPTGSLFV